MILTLILSIAIGLLLGLLGGGGSILTVPMLVYLLNVDPKQAIVTAFVVVGVSSLLALIPHARRGSVCWKSGLCFGLAGMAGAFAGGRLAVQFSGELLMSLFGLISFSIGLLMLRRPAVCAEVSADAESVRACPLRVPFLRLIFDGFWVGAVTGMVGVGGGFMIVPALVFWVGLPMQGAVGTSLLIIAMNALAGLSGYSQQISLDMTLTAIVTSGALLGSGLGAWLSAYVRPAILRQVFGLMVVLVAGYILSQALSLQVLADIPQALQHPHAGLRMWLTVGLLAVVLRIGQWIHKPAAMLPVAPHKAITDL